MKFTLSGNPEDFREIMEKRFILHIGYSKSPDARSIDYISSMVQFKHLGKGGSMFTGFMEIGDFLGFQIQTGFQYIDKTWRTAQKNPWPDEVILY